MNQGERSSDRGVVWQRLAALVLIWVCCTLPVLAKFDNKFIFDDVLVVKNAFIHQPERIGEAFVSPTMVAQGAKAAKAVDTYRPMPLVTFFWDAWLSGHEPWAFHLTSLLLHLGVVSALFFLALDLIPSLWIAAVVALFFGLSPQLGEAHVWINGRSDPLAALFGLLAILVWNRALGATAKTRGMILAALLFLFGLLSKEVLAGGIGAMLFWPRPVDVSPSAQQTFRAVVWTRLKALTPFVAAVLVYAALRLHALKGIRAAQSGHQLGAALRNLPVLWTDGLYELLVPTRLYLRSMRDEYATLSMTEHAVRAAIVIATLALAWVFRKRAPLTFWGLAWFASTLAPAAMIATMFWPGFGRYLYVPCLGVALAVGEGLHHLQGVLLRRGEGRGSRALVVALGAVVAMLLFGNAIRLHVVTDQYADNQTLFSYAVERAPRPAYAFAALGAHYIEARDFARAAFFLDKAAKLDGLETRYLQDLVRATLATGNVAEAERLVRDGIRRAPPQLCGDLRALLMWVIAGAQPEAAVDELCTCLSLQPDSPECRGAPEWLLNPNGRQYARLNHALQTATKTCPSAVGRAVLAELLSARTAPKPAH